MQLIETIEVGSGGAASIEFTGIAGTGQDLLVLISARSTRVDTDDQIRLQINNDTSLNYNRIRLQGTGSAVGTSSDSPIYWIAHSYNATNTTANTFTTISYYIANYAGSTAKSISSESVMENNATFTLLELSAGNWTGTSAITSIQLDGGIGNFAEYTTASLYLITAD